MTELPLLVKPWGPGICCCCYSNSVCHALQVSMEWAEIDGVGGVHLLPHEWGGE